MQKIFTTRNLEETRKLGEVLAEEFKSGGIICLSGDLGAGKTTFTQGFLRGLGAEGPYTSPTFVVMKKYDLKADNQQSKAAYHIDAYRVGAKDVLALGWEEMISEKSSVIIIEWAERIADIIPAGALWMEFKWKGEDEREIVFSNDQFSITNVQSMINE